MTTAGQPGSLVEQEACSAISFDSARPALWDIPVPTDGDPVTSPPLTGCGKDGCASGLDTVETSSTPPTTAPSKILLLLLSIMIPALLSMMPV